MHTEEPNVVLEACKRYKNENDWLHLFINECCKLGEDEKVSSGELYLKYRNYAWHRNEYVCPSNDFKAAMELAGFKTTHPHNKVNYHGIRLLTDNELGVEDDFLS